MERERERSRSGGAERKWSRSELIQRKQNTTLDEQIAKGHGKVSGLEESQQGKGKKGEKGKDKKGGLEESQKGKGKKGGKGKDKKGGLEQSQKGKGKERLEIKPLQSKEEGGI